MKIHGPEETRTLLPYQKLADEIRSVALDRRSGKAEAPERMALPLANGGTLLVMPATDGDIAITKLVSVHPDNKPLGLPTIQGEVIVMEAGTGKRLGVLDGSVVTARRTAALSLLAASELAVHPSGPLLIVGAGTQARSHLEAFHEGLDISKAFITSRTLESAEALALHAADLGMEARVVENPKKRSTRRSSSLPPRRARIRCFPANSEATCSWPPSGRSSRRWPKYRRS